MIDSMYSAPTMLPLVRWSARLLSALIVLFWGFFMVAHLVGDAGQASRPLTSNDYIIAVSSRVFRSPQRVGQVCNLPRSHRSTPAAGYKPALRQNT
jgi:hypothetical protein